MKQILIFSAVTIFIAIPVAYILLKFFFKNTIVFQYGIISILTTAFVAILAYIVGKTDLSNLIWAVPLAIAIVMGGLTIIHNKVSVINNLSEQINRAALGNINFVFDRELATKNNEIGRIINALKKMTENEKISSEIAEKVAVGKITEANELLKNIERNGKLEKATKQMVRKLLITVKIAQKLAGGDLRRNCR